MQNQDKQDSINSSSYWNHRFKEDWEDNKGSEQSRFFARIAAENLPAWFLRYLKFEQPGICDWGCAMGDGTDELKQLLGLDNITGTDFSDIAITTATKKYSSIPFFTADITKDDSFRKFDVVFSSNTLEHFSNPWEIAERLALFATKHLVILVPFEEFDRHHEHFYTFGYDNSPFTLGRSHLLTYKAVIDASTLQPSYWLGKQILLIYSEVTGIEELQLNIADTFAADLNQPETFRTDTAEAGQTVLFMAEMRKILLRQEKRLLDNQAYFARKAAREQETLRLKMEELQKEKENKIAEAAELSQKLQLISQKLKYMENSASWKYTSFLRRPAPPSDKSNPDKDS